MYFTINEPLQNKHLNDLVEIFQTNGWPEASYPENALSGFQHAEFITAAFEEDGKLIGVARASGDTLYCATIDVVCVHKSYQKRGVGSHLVSCLLHNFNNCMYTSVSPNCSSNEGFYERFGFSKVEGGSLLQIERIGDDD